MFVTVVDPIRKRKKELEDERLPEFAPPASYFKSEKSPSSKKSIIPSTTIHNDLIYNPVDTTFDHTENSYQLPPLFSHPIPPTSNDSITEGAADIRKDTVERVFDNAIEDRSNESDLKNSSFQEPDDSIRESVTEVLRYYKSKSALHE